MSSNNKKLLVPVVAVIAIVGVLGVGKVLIAPAQSNTPISNADQKESIGEADSDKKEALSSASKDSIGQIPLAGIPDKHAVNAQSVYAFVRKCSAHKQFAAFMASEKSNPDSLQNNREKFDQLDPKVKAQYQENLAMLVDREQMCAEWEKEASRDVASQQLYFSSLSSALAGDQNAAACFLGAVWAAPDENSDSYQRIRQAYLQNAKALTNAGIARGSWPVVVAAEGAATAEHGLAVSNGFGAEYSYYLARLMQLGTTDGTMAATFGYDAAKFAVATGDKNLTELDARAKAAFSSNFNGHYRDDSSASKCGD